MQGIFPAKLLRKTTHAQKWSQWQNSLKPLGLPAHEIALAVGGQTDYAIVIRASATTQEQKAAEELSHWLAEMTGTEFPVVSDAAAPQNKEISVGRTNRLAAAHLAVAKQDLGDEGYALAAKGDRLFLLGGKKSGPVPLSWPYWDLADNPL